MNYPEIKNAIEHLKKTSTCMQCKSAYELDNIYVIATTNTEGLFELKCQKCNSATIVTMVLSQQQAENRENTQVPQIREHRKIVNPKITENDVLDVQNFLRNFDGDFKRIFPN